MDFMGWGEGEETGLLSQKLDRTEQAAGGLGLGGRAEARAGRHVEGRQSLAAAAKGLRGVAQAAGHTRGREALRAGRRHGLAAPVAAAKPALRAGRRQLDLDLERVGARLHRRGDVPDVGRPGLGRQVRAVDDRPGDLVRIAEVEVDALPGRRARGEREVLLVVRGAREGRRAELVPGLQGAGHALFAQRDGPVAVEGGETAAGRRGSGRDRRRRRAGGRSR